MRTLLKKGLLTLGILTLACNSGELTSSLRNGGVVGSTSSNIPASVVITPPVTPDVTIGTSITLVATVRDAVGQSLTSVAVIWASSDTSVATVSATGVVSGRATGIATISATAGGISASITINVKPIPVNAVSVIVPSTFFVGDSVAAVALPVDAGGNVLSGRIATWSSRNTSIASVSSAGIVIGVGAGTTKIDAIVGGVTGTATVVVSVAPSSVGSVVVAVTAPIISVGQSTQANATVRDSAGNALGNRSVLWTSSNPIVATVSPLGVVTAMSLGTVVISASSGGTSGSAPLTVGSSSALPVATIAVSAIIPTLSPGQSTQAAAVPSDANGNVLVGPTFTWTSTAPAIASVSSSGVITGVTPGTVLITAASGGKTGTLSMQVGAITSQSPATVTVLANLSNPDTLSPGDVVQAMATLRDAGGTVVTTVAPTTWSSSNPGVATVNSIGIVSAKALGTTTITATNSGTIGTATVAVIPPPVKTITISVGSTTLITGRTTQATAVLRDTAGNVLTGRVLNWSHVTPSVATVDANGLITAIGPGSGAIVASSEGRTATIYITVTQPPIASVTISNPTPSILLGQTTQLTTVILDVNGNQVPNALMSWSSSAPAKATVSQTGLVTNVGIATSGSVTITASVSSQGTIISGTISVTLVGHVVETLAALPQVYLNTVAPPAPDVGGVIRSVPAGGNLQAVLIAANPGDVIELAAGAVFTGNYFLPNKNTTSTKWITIRSSSAARLPPEGSRMTASVAATANLPVIRSTNGNAAITTAAGSHHYRLIGIEVTYFAAVSVENYGLITLGTGAETAYAQFPHDIVLDRLYVHGTATNYVRRCITLNDASSAVIDSYVSDCHSNFDAQAVAGWGGPGPYKIVNNYLEASGENLSFGGSDPQILNLIPSDIEIRHNHFFKPTAWLNVWLVKNILELKNSTRVLIEGNIMENNWLHGQNGMAIVFKSVNQNCTAPWSSTTDVTYRYNLLRNVGGGFAIAGAPDTCTIVNTHARRLTITDNVITGINYGAYLGVGDGVQFQGDPMDVLIAHNTMVSPTNYSFVFGGPGPVYPGDGPTVRVSIRDNIVDGSSGYLVAGRNVGFGNPAITTYDPTGAFLANVMPIPSNAGYPGYNLYPTVLSAIGFVNASGADFHLASSSAYKGRASDGRDPGADIDMINTLIANVIVP